jgi:hypothetical protein
MSPGHQPWGRQRQAASSLSHAPSLPNADLGESLGELADDLLGQWSGSSIELVDT